MYVLKFCFSFSRLCLLPQTPCISIIRKSTFQLLLKQYCLTTFVIALKLQNNLGRTDIVTILYAPKYDYGIASYLFYVSFIFSLQSLVIFSKKQCFYCNLVNFTSNFFMFLCNCKWYLNVNFHCFHCQYIKTLLFLYSDLVYYKVAKCMHWF